PCSSWPRQPAPSARVMRARASSTIPLDRRCRSSLKRVVITGAMGSGKSTLCVELCKLGFTMVPEPARIVLAEQRAAGGDGVPERSPRRFCDLMLERMKFDYDEHPSAFYDRGIPDLGGYAHLFGLEPSAARRATRAAVFTFRPAFVAPWTGRGHVAQITLSR